MAMMEKMIIMMELMMAMMEWMEVMMELMLMMGMVLMVTKPDDYDDDDVTRLMTNTMHILLPINLNESRSQPKNKTCGFNGA